MDQISTGALPSESYSLVARVLQRFAAAIKEDPRVSPEFGKLLAARIDEGDRITRERMFELALSTAGVDAVEPSEVNE